MIERRILLINGPNLNMLGTREPALYGHTTLRDIEQAVIAAGRAIDPPIEVDPFQSNHEGALIDRIQELGRSSFGLIINPGGLTHTSVALRDALAATDRPVVEVHMTNIHARETFRHHSCVAPIAVGQVAGFGADGYLMAFDYLARRIDERLLAR